MKPLQINWGVLLTALNKKTFFRAELSQKNILLGFVRKNVGLQWTIFLFKPSYVLRSEDAFGRHDI